ncbi:MAG: hypothetical protein PVJ57_09145 [Phycisphaerae bacterium]|jgi:uncharacterized membrane protein (DUF106 family)
MNFINQVLLTGGAAALWLWAVICKFFSALGGWLDAILNPVLSPLLAVLNPICTSIADALYAVLDVLPVWLGLTILSAVTGVVMLVAFRYVSNQRAIGQARDQITANLLALKLFKDEVRVAFTSQWRLLKALLRLQVHMLLPILIMILPLLLGLAQMGLRYQWRPLHPGEETVLTVRLQPDHAHETDAVLQPNPGVADAIGPVPGGGILVWRLKTGEPGQHTLHITVAGKDVEKLLVVGDGPARVSAERPDRHWTAQLFHPVESPLSADSPVAAIELEHPGVDSWIYGANWWVLYFFIVSMAAALLLKPVFKVRF